MTSIFAPNALAGKRLLITGGGTGLGRAIAKRTAELGADVIICGRREEVLTQTAQAIADEVGATIATIGCDIRESEAVKAMMDKIWAQAPLDVLINNAAGAILGRAETLSARAFDAVLRVTLQGTIYCTLEAGKRWIASNRAGVVLSTIASGADRGQAFTAPLTVAKGAVLTLMRSLAVEWGPKGIRCVAVGPGRFPTEAAANRLGKGRSDDVIKRVPLRRVGQSSELADLCVFLMSDAASFITGEMVTIDGGAALMGQSTGDLFDWTEDQWDLLKPKH
jgi:NAD(P)-dependent dehydrogenase (short-subunit alcohol dehydrogenase family)